MGKKKVKHKKKKVGIEKNEYIDEKVMVLPARVLLVVIF